MYDNHEPRALRQLPLDWRIAQPRRRPRHYAQVIALLGVLALVSWLLISLPVR